MLTTELLQEMIKEIKAINSTLKDITSELVRLGEIMQDTAK